MLTSLVLHEQREIADIALENGQLIEESMVETNFLYLNDSFLIIEDIGFLSKYFNLKAWILVLELVDNYETHATCPVCKIHFVEMCIWFDKCNYWYHFDCYESTAYERSGKSKAWKCSKYGFRCTEWLVSDKKI